MGLVEEVPESVLRWKGRRWRWNDGLAGGGVEVEEGYGVKRLTLVFI